VSEVHFRGYSGAPLRHQQQETTPMPRRSEFKTKTATRAM
jgi:hypothetical protein